MLIYEQKVKIIFVYYRKINYTHKTRRYTAGYDDKGEVAKDNEYQENMR
ncbi:hypothetical protein IR114_00980 [Granulicatella sp. 19428wC4_WM01]|nr:hypothetical protein [Granulicatella sp. 19428wC4_WM01]